MSLLLLIDGYNITQPIPTKRSGSRWLEKLRQRLLRDLTQRIDDQTRQRTCVVFDAANPPKDRPSSFVHEGIEVRFAVDYLTADDLLEELIRDHHTPKKLMVVSSDHRVQIAASRRDAAFRDSQPWMDALTDGRVVLAEGDLQSSGEPFRPSGGTAGQGRAVKPRIEDSGEVDEWMREFGFDPD
ncbi:NYN domain-containing protein [Roseiconus lacunae]|uniref:NYN domain-containing protein n=1 Tax=Roseiconus lacunae TaxID=2605694 RepID=A0ABT7PJ74_9BACT|nr:NYN domain-containing protein [Roseiconus lacunae]MCD0458501.1 NYN domain-containing protein [Roseiconus lacunae]MDM4016388.1 NYN domain-containing protein [Roseiconus lacunae]WRQ52009.1 NYN domain-containing protein [Stieleria sp. HD01]